MMPQQYKLIFGNVEIGIVEETNADFPNFWGKFDPLPATGHPETYRRIQAYIAYSRQRDGLLAQGDGPGSQWEKFMLQNEPRFRDLIECDAWWLVDAAGQRHPILVPNFRVDGVVWRLDPSRDK
jgi:hypothetical protein